MGLPIPLLSLLLALAITPRQTTDSVTTPTYQFIHGNWFDGQGFSRASFFSVNGILTSKRPPKIDKLFDLAGKYILPPYADAHNHSIDGFKRVEERIRKYLTDGVFYVKNPNSIPRYTKGLLGKINISTSVDVIFSNGGLTVSGGHPIELVRRNTGLGIFTEKDAEGGMYYIIDNVTDLDRKWARIIADKPDFIKTYLLYSEEFSKRRDDTAYFGWKGLNPLLLPEIVRRAHHDSLRVSTHIESAKDFHNALVAGVDEINHMPGFRADSASDFSRYEIAEEDAREAGSKGVFVVTTLAGSDVLSATYQEKLDRLHIRNLNILKKYHVRMAIGSDEYRQTSVREAMYLAHLRVFDTAELLRAWCEYTAAAIFPKRKIGRLEEGYEASFVVLSGNPMQDFANTQKIDLRVKQGQIMTIEP